MLPETFRFAELGHSNSPFNCEFEPFQSGKRNVFRITGTSIGVGAVLSITCGSMIILVRKAPRPGFEHSSLWAVPGGMLFPPEDEIRVPVEEYFRQVLVSRVLDETGVAITSTQIERLPWLPPITAYTVKGEKKMTVVIPYHVDVDAKLPLKSVDSSITEVRWCDPAEVCSECCPAARLIASRITGAKWTPEKKSSCKRMIEESFRECDQNADETQMPRFSRDWFSS